MGGDWRRGYDNDTCHNLTLEMDVGAIYHGREWLTQMTFSNHGLNS